MKKTSPPERSARDNQMVSQELDSLNVALRQKGPRPAARRLMEADIEAKARRRRAREKPASAAFKRT
jgi:hypothetical protein